MEQYNSTLLIQMRRRIQTRCIHKISLIDLQVHRSQEFLFEDVVSMRSQTKNVSLLVTLITTRVHIANVHDLKSSCIRAAIATDMRIQVFTSYGIFIRLFQ